LIPVPRKASQQRRRHAGATGVYFSHVVGPDGRKARRYEITYVDSDGRQRWQAVDGDREAAKAERALLLAKIAGGEHVVPTKHTVHEACEQWLDTQDHRPRTTDGYRASLSRHVYPLLGRRLLKDVRADDVAALVSAMRKEGYSPATIRNALKPLAGAFQVAVRRGGMAQNPVRILLPSERPSGGTKRQMRILEPREMTALVDAAKPKPVALAIAVSLYGGTRQSETLALRWLDCDLERGRVRVAAQLGRDGQRAELKTDSAAREIVIPPYVVAMLRERKQQQFAAGFARPEDYVFATRTGNPLGQRNLLRDFYEVLEDADLDGDDGRPRPRWHDLRHTCASVLIGKGIPVTSVAHQLGHANPSITLSF
jgi:integrase